MSYFHVITHHRSMMYYEATTRRICHGPRDWAPANLMLEVKDDEARWVWTSPDGTLRRPLRVVTDEGFANFDDDEDAYPWKFDQEPSGTVTLRLGQNFLSADSDGLARSTRQACQAWERFTLASIDAGAAISPAAPTDLPEPLKISGFVITYNREAVVETCLQSMRFVDELIVVDKSSTDGTVEIARRYADRLVVVPWTPTADDTRAYAASLCSHDLIAFLDDDECFTADAIKFIQAEARAPRADIYSFPFLTYYLGWAGDNGTGRDGERHERLYRRGTIHFQPVIHGAVAPVSLRRHWIPSDSPACVYHFSVTSIERAIEKSNRYTSQPVRASWFDNRSVLSADFIRARLDHWLAVAKTEDKSEMPSRWVVQLIYDLIDLLKHREARELGDPDAEVAEACQRLQAEYSALDPELRLRSPMARPALAAAVEMALDIRTG